MYRRISDVYDTYARALCFIEVKDNRLSTATHLITHFVEFGMSADPDCSSPDSVDAAQLPRLT